MIYKHFCVIDEKQYYKDFVVAYPATDKDGKTENVIPDYELDENESLLDADPPSGFVRPHWDGTMWEEGATPEEIEQWKQQAPPLIDFSGEAMPDQRIVALEQQATDTQLALAEAYEQADEKNTDLLMATAELYEALLALQERVAVLEGGVQNG